MPEIARFYGIVVKIYFGREHNPPHVHCIYGEKMASFDLRDLSLLEGDLPLKAIALCTEWLQLYKNELMEMWNTQTIHRLPPLE